MPHMQGDRVSQMKRTTFIRLHERAELRREWGQGFYAVTVAAILAGLVAAAVWGHAAVSIGFR